LEASVACLATVVHDARHDAARRASLDGRQH
jgi:hypothetical protein